MIAICLRCGNTSDNLDTHDAHQAAAGHQDWDREPRHVPRPLRAPCPTCGAELGTPCLTELGNERRNLDIHETRRLQIELRERLRFRA